MLVFKVTPAHEPKIAPRWGGQVQPALPATGFECFVVPCVFRSQEREQRVLAVQVSPRLGVWIELRQRC